MEEQYIHNLKIEEFARLCGRSLSSFKREFKNTYSMTPGKWLTKKRLDLARNLLLKTNNTIQEICYDSGFESDSHFIRIFKNNFGFTPKQWRASKLKATD
jgi:AraC-like DNA-binding protein